MINKIQNIFTFLKNPSNMSYEDFSSFWFLFYGSYKNFCDFWIDDYSDFKRTLNDGTIVQDSSIANILVCLNIYPSKTEVLKSIKNNGLRINNQVVNPNNLLSDLDSFQVFDSDLRFWVIKKGKTDFQLIWF